MIPDFYMPEVRKLYDPGIKVSENAIPSVASNQTKFSLYNDQVVSSWSFTTSDLYTVPDGKTLYLTSIVVSSRTSGNPVQAFLLSDSSWANDDIAGSFFLVETVISFNSVFKIDSGKLISIALYNYSASYSGTFLYGLFGILESVK